ncbi:MAG: isochorismatase family protein [Oscillospiraceae bacterium]
MGFDREKKYGWSIACHPFAGRLYRKYPPFLLARINERLQQATAVKEFIVSAKNTKRLKSGKKTEELAENLNICSESILCRERASAFCNPELQGMLRKNRITETEMIGIDGNSCIANTTINSVKSGYKTILPCAYIGVENAIRFEKNEGFTFRKRDSCFLKIGILLYALPTENHRPQSSSHLLQLTRENVGPIRTSALGQLTYRVAFIIQEFSESTRKASGL